jgi:hypothetical protein
MGEFCSPVCNDIDFCMLSVSYWQKFWSELGAGVCVCVRACVRACACVVDGIENCVSTFIILVFKHAILSYVDIAQINTESWGIWEYGCH